MREPPLPETPDERPSMSSTAQASDESVTTKKVTAILIKKETPEDK